MTFLRSTRRVAPLACAALLALGACKDSTGSGGSRSGSVHFTYTGTDAGTYSAEGRFSESRAETTDWAFGYQDVQGGQIGLIVLANQELPGGLSNQVLLFMENPTVGEVTCTINDVDCPVGLLLAMGVPDGQDVEPEILYSSVAGRLRITRMEDGRVVGDFSFEAEDLFGGFEQEDPAAIQITSGTFDVPLIQDI
ncbi:MAG TPA: hypothetical protein VFQ45_22200 [Longimicrobium sp.]|nr:hypothetical protein [Longimicrobium sp.]